MHGAATTGAASRRGRRPADRGDTERTIRRAALRRFADLGFDAAALRDIAADAGVDPAMIAYRFGSKLSLWKAVVEAVGAGKIDMLRRTAAAKASAAASPLAASMEALVDLYCANETVPRFLLRDAGHDPERAAWVFDHVSRPLLDHFLPLIRRANETGRIATPVPEMFLLSFAYGVAVSVVRREMLAGFAPQLANDNDFRAALYATLIEPRLRHG
ncbi:TetR/AcrR family transcriptional regulator [Sphingopyxis granuli]|uniref:TetR/AcrR family transcriptional regulator n=1 Tax=Sphingopyxis granuli TaxID=267128 RepID=UPI00082AE23C|nr:TetR/AcrR family transcriptional regulator [Sphingopyxis granuli]